ncbi:hypothetical protein QJS66_20185 [Kocuria rhizophila]|nr:hypothetical protein QJS66_20185 [Kocuria rhizophila]
MGEAPRSCARSRSCTRSTTDWFVRHRGGPDPWDGDRVRRTEQLRQEDGDRSLMAVVQDLRTGELVGMTELILAQRRRAGAAGRRSSCGSTAAAGWACVDWPIWSSSRPWRRRSPPCTRGPTAATTA